MYENAHPVSSLKGRSPEKPGRLLMIDCEATALATAKKQTMQNHIVLMLLLEMVCVSLTVVISGGS